MEVALFSRFVWSEKSAIIPTKNNYSNIIQIANKQNLKTYWICGKLNDGLNVPAASLGKVYDVLIYSLGKVLQNQIIRWKKCEAYYSTLCFRSEKNAFIPTKNRTSDYL